MSEQTIEPENEIADVPLEPVRTPQIVEDAPVEPVAEVPVKENKPAFVLHKFEKAVEKKYEFSLTGQDLLMYGIGFVALVVAAFIYGRLSVEVVENGGV